MVPTMHIQYTAHTRCPLLPAARIALCLLLALAFLTGCQKAIVTPPMERTPSAYSQSLPDQAFAAYSRGDYQKAETLYDRTLQLPELSHQATLDAWKYFAISTTANGKYHMGLEALEKWLSLDHGADTSTDWLNTFSQCMLNIPRQKAATMLSAIISDKSRPWAVRAESSMLLINREWSDSSASHNDIAGAMQKLADLYKQTPEKSGATANRSALESRLFAQLQQAEANDIAKLAGLLTSENELRFPYAVVLLEKARRSATDSKSWPVTWQALQKLRQASPFADKQLLERIITPLVQQFGKPAQGIALALPLTGPYGNIGWKIMRGAGVAQWEMARVGGELSVTVINTAADGWEEKLKALPEGIRVVGGPLRKEAFDQIKSQDMLRQRAFFTFLSNLGEGEEGHTAWRFFSSPRDQVQSVLEFSKNELGVEKYGVLYPDEPFGDRMNALFRETAADLGVSANSVGAYAPKDPESWGKTLKPMLRVPAPRLGEEDSMPPEPPFQAVFMPDGWQQMRSLIPHFFFYQEDRMIFLGSALWEQGLSANRDTETRYFKLAVFPGSWNPFTPTAAATNLSKTLDESGLGKPDFWVGLGYDFVRFASLLGASDTKASAKPSARDMNERILAAQNMDWSIAPIQWTKEGMAAQKMFLFTPASEGFVPLDPQAFRDNLASIKERHAERVKMLNDAYSAKRAAKAQ